MSRNAPDKSATDLILAMAETLDAVIDAHADTDGGDKGETVRLDRTDAARRAIDRIRRGDACDAATMADLARDLRNMPLVVVIVEADTDAIDEAEDARGVAEADAEEAKADAKIAADTLTSLRSRMHVALGLDRSGAFDDDDLILAAVECVATLAEAEAMRDTLAARLAAVTP
jgi:hypothetical protein